MSENSVPSPEELEKLIAGENQAAAVASQQVVHRRFQFNVQPGPENSRLLILTTILPSGVPLVEDVYVYENPENAAALGNMLSAPSIVLPGQNGTHA